MTVTDVIAIVGAGAWLPHVFKFIKDRMTRPEVRIVTQRTAEISYTTFGPILNLRIAFTVRHRDVVISGIRIRLRHESGEEQILSWQGTSQQLVQIQTPEQIPLAFNKELSVLAIKLTTKDVEERLFRFQEDDFLMRKEEHESKAAKKYSYLSQPGPCNLDDFLQSEEMKDVYSFMKHRFNWKQGRYTMAFEVESPEAFTLKDNQYEFSLNLLHVEPLEANKSLIELAYEDVFKAAVSGYQPHKPKWNWVNPIIKKLPSS